MKYILFIFLLFLSTGCAYNIVQEITFHEDRTFDLKVGFDFSSSFSSDQQAGIAMLMNGFINEQKKKIKDTSLSNVDIPAVDFDNDTLQFKYEMALDTIFNAHDRDSLKEMLAKSVEFKDISDEKREMIIANTMHILDHSYFVMEFNAKEEKCYGMFEMDSVSIDAFEYLSKIQMKDSIVEKVNKSGFSKLFTFDWKKNKVVFEDGSAYFNKYHLDSIDSISIDASKLSYYIVKYNLPAKVKKCSNPHFKKQNNGKTLYFKESFYDIANDNIHTDVKIVY